MKCIAYQGINYYLLNNVKLYCAQNHWSKNHYLSAFKNCRLSSFVFIGVGIHLTRFKTFNYLYVKIFMSLYTVSTQLNLLRESEISWITPNYLMNMYLTFVHFAVLMNCKIYIHVNWLLTVSISSITLSCSFFSRYIRQIYGPNVEPLWFTPVSRSYILS